MDAIEAESNLGTGPGGRNIFEQPAFIIKVGNVRLK